MEPTIAPTRDEGEHHSTGDRAWHEAHRVDAVFPAAAVALTLMITKHPARGHASFHAAMMRLGHAPVVVVEFDVPLPDQGWEIRASGLWADHVCETAMDHWSYGLEAFGLAIDDPRELLGRGVGDRVPLGWELEFEARADALLTGAASRYGQIGSVHGVLLEHQQTTDIDGYGVRSHWWGLDPPRRIELGAPPSAQELTEQQPTVVLPAVAGRWSTVVTDAGAVSWFDSNAAIDEPAATAKNG